MASPRPSNALAGFFRRAIVGQAGRPLKGGVRTGTGPGGRTTEPVDLALVLALDGSASVTFEEFNLMAGGLAAALQDSAVVAGLTGGPQHASLGALLLWSGAGAQEVLVDWTRIA